jgi:hypothetical protein
MSQAKEKFYTEYLKNKKPSELSDEEKREVLVKVKNHFIFYKNISEEPGIKPTSLRLKDANAKMKALRDLKNELIEQQKTI